MNPNPFAWVLFPFAMALLLFAAGWVCGYGVGAARKTEDER